MLHELPITNVRLSACSVVAEQLTPVAGGHFCAECQRVVHDFTQASLAELMQAQASATDGRVCGRFRVSQLAAPKPLRLRQRCFLVAAVLVLLQGLSACEAEAQRPASPGTSTDLRLDELADTVTSPTAPENTVFGAYIEKMPEFPGGLEKLQAYLRHNLHYPDSLVSSLQAQGKVFISFTVLPTGQIEAAEIVKGVHPALDAEALRVVRNMPAWVPGAQNNLPVSVRYTLPITFSNGADQPQRDKK